MEVRILSATLPARDFSSDYPALMLERVFASRTPKDLVMEWPNSGISGLVRFTLSKTQAVRLTIFDSVGRMAILVDEPLEAGTHILKIEPDPMPEEIFFFDLRVGDFYRIISVTP
jgi:hypothetical protein